MSTTTKNFVLGETPLPVPGKPSPKERKSPPLDAVTPDHRDFYQVDPALYIDPRYRQLEWDRLWTKTWINVGRVSDLPRVGSWLQAVVGPESFIVTRSAEDRLSAFHNVCQHRGARLVSDDFGRTSVFVCPYHSWSYDREGRCRSITDRDLFCSESLSGQLDIRQVRCDTFGGFVFICMDQNAPPLHEYLDDIPDLLAGYRLDELIVHNDIMVDLACNWKTMLDAFSENYHVHIAHPAAAGLVDDREVQMDFYPHGHARRITPIAVHNSRKGAVGPANPAQRVMLEAAGIDPESYDGDSGTVRRSIQLAKRAMTGRPAEIYGTLTDNQLTDDWAMNIFPNMHWSIHAEGVLLLEYFPHPSDPEQCQLHIMVLGHAGMNFVNYMPPSNDHVESERPQRVRVRHDDPDIIAIVTQLLWEDISLTAQVQRGMRSGAFKAIRLSEHEQVIRHQHAHIRRYLDRE
nr:aromatic ring-hydroxylating dioxygenase subunit alpha [Sphingomonas sp. CDS-1]